MQKLFQMIALAIAAIAGYRSTIKALREQVSTLQAKVDEDEAQLKLNTDVQTQIEQADAKADELASALNEEDSVPSVHPDTFEVTAPPTASLQDLAFRENQDLNSGKVAPAPEVKPAAAPAAPATEEKTGDQSQPPAGDQSGQGQQQTP